jgi:hypothetical protein
MSSSGGELRFVMDELERFLQIESLRQAHGGEAIKAHGLYAAVGYALTQWSILEEALCSIYILAVAPHHKTSYSPAGASFWAIATFDGKLRMTHAAVSIWARDIDDVDREWGPLYNALGKKNPKRNDLAHGTVVTQWREGEAATFFAPSHFRRFYTTDPTEMVDYGTWPIPPEGRLSAKDIQQRAEGFKQMATRLRGFRRILYFHLRQRGEVGLPADKGGLPRHTEATPTSTETPPPDRSSGE